MKSNGLNHSCRLCGQPVPASHRARPRVFCSDAHRLQFHRQQRDPRQQVANAQAYDRAHPVQAAEKKRRYKRRHPDIVAAQKARHFIRHQATLLERKWWRKWRQAFGGQLSTQDVELLTEFRRFKQWLKTQKGIA